jgi:acetyltransferase-like isoleucine patch superfamily enzyme
MDSREYLRVPREGVSDDSVEVSAWLVAEGAHVEAAAPVVEIETSKAVVTLEAHRRGYVSRLATEGQRVRVGEPIAMITDERHERVPDQSPTGEPPLVSKKAALLMQQNCLTADDFAGLKVIREQDVTDFVSRYKVAASLKRSFAGEPLAPDADWDGVFADPRYQELRTLATELRRRMKARFHRHVPTGTLLYDRWDLARDYEFGEGTSVYDECLILGNVTIGRHCWIGPFTVLDGAWEALTIGDFSQIGSGSQLYTHNTIEHVLTGHHAEAYKRPTTVGRCCFVSPLSVIGPGTTIGDHSFVASASFVQGEFPPFSYIAGSPARRVGTVQLQNGRAQLRLDDE